MLESKRGKTIIGNALALFGIVLSSSAILITIILTTMKRTMNIGFLRVFVQGRLVFVIALMVLGGSIVYIGINIRKVVRNRESIAPYVLSLVSTLFITPLLVVLFFYSVQTEIIEKNGIVLQPVQGVYDSTDGIQNVEELEIRVEKNVLLNGWLIKNADVPKAPLVIYFGGSAQEVSSMVRYFSGLKGYAIALVNYRGFGDSQGKANEKNLYQDGQAIYDMLVERPDIDPGRVYTIGYSLGSAISVNVAANRPVKGVILISPVSNMAKILQPYYRNIPLSIFLKEKFDSLKILDDISCPLLCIVGGKDRDIKPEYSKELYDRWNGKKELVEKAYWDHYSWFHRDSGCVLIISQFLDKINN